MEATALARLLALNREFYTRFGVSFSATRGRIQPGVRRVLDRLEGRERILDLGCGNGGLARELARRGHRAAYLGLDFSRPLLEGAALGLGVFPARFAQADLTSSDWEKVISDQSGRPLMAEGWSLITAFAVLHHIPGHELRLSILRKVHRLLAAGGRFVHSEWQFLNSPRLRARIQPWETTALTAADVDPGDYLLEWRHAGRGLRYVHHFSEAELADLAQEAGFQILETFLSDGENGRLGLYQIWEKGKGDAHNGMAFAT